jgi:hypothetical protein
MANRKKQPLNEGMEQQAAQQELVKQAQLALN